ncbi:MAG: tape measure protein [Rickettsiales bacterium]|nr:tape measure protein [Pseudomonadota bacterium]MDA0966886.1 tape measure protein [Pseudomonadota bacterium]MDG4543561.1 tape measure protein [Rickettsiales bacterium]MDG4545709.1 tape measure protein [Rickettsiales bacterium]MDG4547518.1 tape measure protein [Rickettsiales bacterium]
MATTIDSLLVKFEVNNRQLKEGFAEANNQITGFSNKAKASFALIAGAYSAAFALKGMTDVITKFEKLEASLITVTGSSEKAAKEFEKLQDFASTTPFQLAEVVDSFIKMKALGLDPSEKALNSYGNTASAMGKGLNQMIEAVADASTGEFERLKEFGIKAKQEGDNVTFTFQGVSTTIRKNADEISSYLQSIGDNQFAGAMERQADTLNVALSNMNDSFDKLIKAIGDAGLTNLLINSADAMKELADNTRENIPLIQEWGDRILSTMPQTGAVWNMLKSLNSEQQTNNMLVKEGIDLQTMMAGSGMGGIDPNAPVPVGKPEEEAAKAVEEAERKRELLQRDLEMFQQSLMTKSELEDENYAARMEKLQIFKENELISEQEYNSLFENEMIRHQDKAEEIRKQGLSRLEKFQEMSYKDQAKTVFGELENITAGVAQHNRAFFEANKVAAIANATIKAYDGINTTWNSYPFPVNVGMAAAHAAVAFQHIRSIKNTSFSGGGGGSAPSISGSTPAAPVTPTTGAGSGSGGTGSGNASSILDLVISGITEDELYSGRQIDNIIKGINERIGDGASLGSVRLS